MTLLRGRNDRGRGSAIGLLDIGTSKVAAAVAVADGENDFRIAGLGLHRSRGVKAGVLTDLDAAEAAVRGAIGQAERAAGVTLDGVIVSFAAGRLKSRHFAARTEVASGTITAEDIARVARAGADYAERDGRSLVHLSRLGYRLDGSASGHDIRGMAARTLAADYHAVTADEGPLRNLLLLIEHCYLTCDSVIAAPYASALAVTTPEERELGVTVIDMGAGTTSIALFAEGHLVGVDVVPVGSQHMTFDIARALQTPLSEAERIKTLYGTLIAAQSNAQEVFSYTIAGEDDGATYQTTRARLTDIIRPRFAQTFALVRERLGENPASAYAGETVVLTGGASQMLGVAQAAGGELGRNARVARPHPVAGFPSSVAGPHFATLCGLAAAFEDQGDEVQRGPNAAAQSYLGRVGSWLKASF